VNPDPGLSCDLSIVVVNYNGGDEILRCLESLSSLSDSIRFEVIVVDNGSEDGSADQVERTYPLFRVIRAGENLGFARACNRGLEQTRGRHAMLLNPDTQVTDGALDKLVAALGAHPTWGVVGPQMIDADGYRYRAARRFPTPFYLFAEITHLSSLFPRSRRIAGYGYGDRTI